MIKNILSGFIVGAAWTLVAIFLSAAVIMMFVAISKIIGFWALLVAAIMTIGGVVGVVLELRKNKKISR